MRKQVAIVGIVVLLISIGLSGCDETATIENKFIGTWNEIDVEVGAPTTVTFFSNGTFYGDYFGLLDTWELKDGTIVFSYQGEAYATYYYEFFESDMILNLTIVNSDRSIIFEKQ
jgi:hypothetical protein